MTIKTTPREIADSVQAAVAGERQRCADVAQHVANDLGEPAIGGAVAITNAVNHHATILPKGPHRSCRHA